MISCLFKVDSKQIYHSDVRGLARQQATGNISISPGPDPTESVAGTTGTQVLQKKSGCFKYIKHTASKGNSTACIKSTNVVLFLPTIYSSVLPKETSSPSWLKG